MDSLPDLAPVLDKVPDLLVELERIVPGVAVVAVAICAVRYGLVPLVKAWRGK